MLDMFIWNWVMFEANADRATGRSTFGASGAFARVGSEPIMMIFRMWSGVSPPTVGSAALENALPPRERRRQRMVRDRGEPGVAVWMCRAEVGQPLVVDAQD